MVSQCKIERLIKLKNKTKKIHEFKSFFFIIPKNITSRLSSLNTKTIKKKSKTFLLSFSRILNFSDSLISPKKKETKPIIIARRKENEKFNNTTRFILDVVKKITVE